MNCSFVVNNLGNFPGNCGKTDQHVAEHGHHISLIYLFLIIKYCSKTNVVKEKNVYAMIHNIKNNLIGFEEETIPPRTGATSSLPVPLLHMCN
jgi:hypothetical protein